MLSRHAFDPGDAPSHRRRLELSQIGRYIVAWRPSLATVLFVGALALFAFTRLYRLEAWPIYFFTDEAVQTTLAAAFVDNGFRDHSGRLFPTYFQNDTYWNLSVSVYAQIIPYKLFGFSLFWTRATSALIALFGTAAVGLILRDVFRFRFWWTGTLLLSITPAWFLHSRTAFETVIGVSFYAWALYCYLRYRTDRPWFLLPAVLFAALAFYSYSGTQLTLAATAGLLLLSDARYHWQQRHILLAALALGAMLALPYLRFRLQQSDEVYLHLRTLNSYWVDDHLSTMDKLRRFWSEYRHGFSINYWYRTEDGDDLLRHQMAGWGFIWLPTLPLAALGAAICLKNMRSAPHRAVLLALLAAPAGGALVAIAITRVLLLVVPAALLAAIGLEPLLRFVARFTREQAVALAAFVVLAIVNIAMLRSAVNDGPTWYDNYGLYGTQFGARQIADGVRAELGESPDSRIIISPRWTNGGDVVFHHLLGDDEHRYTMGGLESYREGSTELTDDLMFVLTKDEYDQAASDPAFEDLRIERTIRLPNGADGFFFVRLRASPLAGVIAELEQQDRRRLVTGTVEIDGETVRVTHSQFDIGGAWALFDGDELELARTFDGNPAVIDIAYASPHNFTGLRLSMGTHVFDVTVHLYIDGSARPAATYQASFPDPGIDPTVDIPFADSPSGVTRVRISIRERAEPQNVHVHIREVELLE